jgi:hypothetical protein
MKQQIEISVFEPSGAETVEVEEIELENSDFKISEIDIITE